MAKFQLLHAGSTINWTGRKLLGLHTGSINLKNGFIDMDGNELRSGQIGIDMTSITITDIDDPETNQQFKAHLFNDDFFSVSQFPVASFLITKATAAGNGQHHVEGTLTIKSITHPASFIVRLEVLSEFLHVSGELVIDRTLYNVRYGSGRFFENLGDKLVHDDFILQFKLIGQRYE